MKTTGSLLDVSMDFRTGKGKLALLIDTTDLEVLDVISNFKDKKLDIEIKKHIEKRSGKSNRYFWELLEEVCDRKKIDKLEEYRRRVKELGIFRVSKIPSQDFETLKKTWENWGEAWFCEVGDTEIIGDIEFKIVFLYYGSSSFSKQQMSRLIDNLVQDCKAIGIETKSPKEIESMLKEYDKK